MPKFISCRNPMYDPEGPYCYLSLIDDENPERMFFESCDVPQCPGKTSIIDGSAY